MTSSAMPAFGQADLSNCEREQIHLAGSIQPHGALLLLDELGLNVLQASTNAGSLLGIPGEIVGRDLTSLAGNLASRLHAHLDDPLHEQAVALRAHIGTPPLAFDALVHRPTDGGIVVELEPAGPAVRLHDEIEAATQSIVAADTLNALGDRTTELVKRLTGYDRVMVYRFDDLGHGEVMSESREPELEAFLGNRYPASDIPQIARRLYLQNRMRLLVDVDYEPVPLVPRLCPLSGRDLDMSMSSLRSMSPIHLQYLKNMGVQATLVLSIVVGGELWGLIACHHYAARFVPYETRALCDIVAELVATRVAALESAGQTRAELSVRRIETKMRNAASRGEAWQAALFDGSAELLGSLQAAGAALVFGGTIQTVGKVPETILIQQLTAWLDGRPRELVMATASIGRDVPGFRALLPVAAGVAATPVSAAPGEYLLWFRPERKTTVTWGGDPTKPVVVGTDPRQLSPRLSFAQWHEVVEGTSDPWTRPDLITAKLIGETISALVLQAYSVRMLIAQGELEELSRQVRDSRQAVLVANAGGRIILTNEAFAALLPPGRPIPQRLDDLPRLFARSLKLIRHVDDMVARGRSFFDGAVLAGLGTAGRPMTIRGEPIFEGDRNLGYIVHVDEVTDRIAADAARERFEDGLVERHPTRTNFDLRGDRAFEATYAKIVENARLAALEITYGAEVDGMPRMLDSVRASLARTADLLEHLIWHASGIDGDPN